MKKLLLVSLLVLALGVAACAPAVDPNADPNITIEDPWARPSPMAEGMGAAYMVFENTGGDDALIGARTDVAAVVEIHEVTMEDDVMRMRPVEGQRLSIPAGGDVTLEPGGYHIMLIDLNQQLVPGETFMLTLEFERSGTRDVMVTVRESDGSMPDDGEMDHSNMP